MMEFAVTVLENPQAVYEVLSRDRRFAAYALGCLEPSQWPFCTALLASERRGGAARALYLLSQPPEGATLLFLLGDPEGVRAIFQQPQAALPFAWIHAQDELIGCLKKYWRLEGAEKMLRMAVGREDFRAPKNSAGVALRPLRTSDGEALSEAYETAFGIPATSRLLERGPYYGVWEKGNLVAVAGTHLLSPRYGAAAVGNVWTRTSHRGRGLGTLTVGAVTQELLGYCDEVVLNVREDNKEAQRVYEKLGYSLHCSFWQLRSRWKR
jgi:ribosomal protein S18 acetylase RimI-like enzyme